MAQGVIHLSNDIKEIFNIDITQEQILDAFPGTGASLGMPQEGHMYKEKLTTLRQEFWEHEKKKRAEEQAKATTADDPAETATDHSAEASEHKSMCSVTKPPGNTEPLMQPALQKLIEGGCSTPNF